MQDFLTLSTGTNGPAPQRVAPISGTSPRQSRVRQTLGGLNQAYSALDMTKKGGWQLAANTLNQTHNRTGRHKISPANAFVTLNSARLACGLTVISDAPADLTAPPLLPAVTVQTSAPATAQALGTGAFSLNLTCPAAYTQPVHILAAAPAPAGKTTFPDADFKAIGSLPSLQGDGDDIATLYSAVFGTPEPGAQLALKLIATSDAGIRLTPLVLTGIVTTAPAADAKKSPLHIG